MNEGTLFDTHRCPNCGFESIRDSERSLDRDAKARSSDPDTSGIAARMVSAKARTMRVRLLEAHARYPQGLTDEEAAEVAGISLQSEYATRCSELMRAALLIDTMQRRVSSTGTPRLVRAITPAGMEVLRRREGSDETASTP